MKQILGLTALLTVFSLPVMAAAPDAFSVTNDWQVDEASDGCVFSNRFENGFDMRIAASEGAVKAVFIDFQQDIFEPGASYTSGFSVDSRSFGQAQGQAQSASSLMYQPGAFNGFYDALKSGSVLSVDVEGNPMRFALNGFGAQADCGPANAPDVRGAALKPLPRPALVVSKLNDPAPDMKNREVYIRRQQRDFVPPSELAEQVLDEPAVSGEGFSAIETAAGSNHPEPILYVEPEKGPEPIDLLKVREVEQSKVAMAATKSKAEEVALLEPASGQIFMPKDDVPAAQPVMVSRRPVEKMYQPQPTEVSVMDRQGESLRGLLTQWSAQKGFQLQWEADRDYALKGTVMSEGTLEQSLGALLTSYENDMVRPVGQLNTDPATNRKLLIIQTERRI